MTGLDWTIYGPAAGIIAVLVWYVVEFRADNKALRAELAAEMESQVAIREKRIETLTGLFSAKVTTDMEQVAAWHGVRDALCELSRRVEALEDAANDGHRGRDRGTGPAPRAGGRSRDAQ